MFQRLFLFCVLLSCSNLLSAQYKKLILPDSFPVFPYYGISIFNSSKVVETGIPGREIAISGTIAGSDSSGFGYQNIFLMQTDRQGQTQNFNMFEDQDFFAPFSRSYSFCYDGTGNFYHAMGSSSKAVVLKMNDQGAYQWASGVHHHDFYGITWNGSSATLLGQDEPIGGDHEFSLIKYDPAGNPSSGMMFGTPGFEVPEKLIYKDHFYVMTGSSFQNSTFYLMVIKADDSLNQVWGNYWELPNARLTSKDICQTNDSRGYIGTGYGRVGANDSLLIYNLDSAGNMVWAKLYGMDSVNEIQGFSIAPCGNSGGYLICGAYRGQTYRRPFIIKIDESGNVLWSRGYADGEENKEEVLSSIIMSQTDGFFYACGEYVQVDSLSITRAVLLIKALPDQGVIPCDSLLNLGSRSVNFSLAGTTSQSPFTGGVPVSFLANSGPMKVETRCSLLTAKGGDLPDPITLVYTNPAFGFVEVETVVPQGNAVLEIFSIEGKLMKAEQIPNGNERRKFNLNGFSEGLYLIRIQVDGQVSKIGRLVVLGN